MGVVVGLLAGAGLLLIWLAFTVPMARTPKPQSRVRRLLTDADLPGVSPLAFITGSSMAGFAVCVVVFVFTTGITVSLIAGTLAATIPLWWVHSRARRTRKEVFGVWPETLEVLISAVRSGLPLAEAVSALAESGPPPIRSGFAVFRHTLHVTGRIDDALDAVKERFADPVADRIMEALRVAKDVGGQDVGIVLRALATHVRREQRTRGELEARQSWTVNGARLAAASPWLILALLCMRPENARAFDSAAGAGVLAVGAVLTFIAHRIMRWIGRLPTESRSLA